jgi:beta-xylosidase
MLCLVGPAFMGALETQGAAATNAIPLERMQQVYDEVKTPFKYGIVIRGEADQKVDCPSIFRQNGQWYMVYVGITGKTGYETFLARSEDLLHWEKLGKILSFPPEGWDKWQADGGIALCDPTWGGSCELQAYDDKYWMSYIGGGLQGYETDPLAIGIAWSKTPTAAREWTRIAENPVLSRTQPDVRAFEKETLYKSQIIWDKAETLGHPFVMFYNGKIKSGYEKIGMAVSDNMTTWQRYGKAPVVANGEDKQRGISGDPQLVRMDDLWVMFYFGAFYQPGAFDTFACSKDLVHWTKWNGPHLIQPSEAWDQQYAHKPWVVKHEGIVYHFYCAVGNEGRVIALATSKDLKKNRAAEGDTAGVTGNPILPGKGVADPHVLIDGERAYLYAGHDFSPTNKGFVMKEWWVWASDDLVNWKQEGTLKPEDTFLKRPSNECWAGFGTRKNEKYYWYFSAGPTEIGVVTADAPAGPWKDPLGKPLVPKDLTKTEARDPDILIDDDGKAYMVFGTFDHFIVRLNEDMISLAETPRLLVLDQKFGPYGAGKTDDKPALHKRNNIYYLSWSSFYAMSTNVYGPYTYKGSVIAPERVASEFQIDTAVRKYDLWHDRHGNFFTWHNQWFYIVNDKSLPGRHTAFRETCISYVHYRDNGEIDPVRLDRTGVGQYDATQPRIEAEDFFKAEHVKVRESSSGGFEVHGLAMASRLVYPNVKNLPEHATLTCRAASGHAAGGTIEVRENAADGRLLGTCSIPNTGGWNSYKSLSFTLKNEAGTKSLCLIFKGAAGELMRLDWLRFSQKAQKTL